MIFKRISRVFSCFFFAISIFGADPWMPLALFINLLKGTSFRAGLEANP